jgi:hypothetical protein
MIEREIPYPTRGWRCASHTTELLLVAQSRSFKPMSCNEDYGVAAGTRRVTLGDHCQAWMEKIVVNMKPKTLRFYRQMTEHYLLPYLGERAPIKKIAAEHIIFATPAFHGWATPVRATKFSR